MSTLHAIVDFFLWGCAFVLIIIALRWFWSEPEEDREYQTLKDELSAAVESNMYTHQNLNEANRRVELMTKYRSKDDLEKLSADAAEEIEDRFIQANSGGREGRLKDVQEVVKEVISEALTGTNYYKGE